MVSQGTKHNTVCRCAYWRAVIYQVMPTGVLRMSFQALGLDENCREARDVLSAWRRLAREHQPDKTGDVTSVMMQDLNAAKEQCLGQITSRDPASELEFAQHICKVLDRSLERDGITGINLVQGGGARIVGCKLRKFYWIRTVDAMEWILRCGMGDAAFSQEIEDEIPILCKYYNEFIGEERWTEHDHTMMTVLNKYDRLKAGGYGNFARFIDASAQVIPGPTAVPPLSPQQGEEQSLLQ